MATLYAVLYAVPSLQRNLSVDWTESYSSVLGPAGPCLSTPVLDTKPGFSVIVLHDVVFRVLLNDARDLATTWWI